ncbi:MAG: hypothetical protein ACI9VO_000824 [Colwellia sp.]|jgi:hypothetical protein
MLVQKGDQNESRYAVSAHNFADNITHNLANNQLRANFSVAMDKRKNIFPNDDKLETLCEQ